MTNEAAQLSPGQRRSLSPLTTSHSDSRKGANRAVCYTSRYLLQMETAFARFAWQGKTRTRSERPGASAASLLSSGMPGNILERVGARNRRENLSEAISSLPGVLALLCDGHFVLCSSGKMFPPKLPEMHIWI